MLSSIRWLVSNLSLLLVFSALLTPNKVSAQALNQDADEAPNYRAGKIYSLRAADTEAVRALQAQFDVWRAASNTDGSGNVDLWADEHALLRLKALGYQPVLNAKLSASLQLVPEADAAPSPNGINGFPCYRTVEESFASMDALVGRFPNLARTITFGSSYLQSVGQGGYPMRALVIENSAVPAPASGKPTLLLIAAIHAREYATAEIALRFAETLLNGYAHQAELRWLVDNRRIIIAPQTNPDGRKRAETGVSQRRNLRPSTCATNSTRSGIDLNRNSSFLWGTNNGSSTNGCDETYRGPSAASEPEVQALQTLIADSFVDRRGPLDTDAAPNDTEGVFISLHSYADMVLFPWGATTQAAPNKAGLQTFGRKLGFYTGYQVCQPPEQGCLYAASGTTDDQSYGELGVASVTFEVGNAGFFEACSIFESTTVSKNIDALIYALKAARRPYLEASGPEVTQLQAQLEVLEGDELVTITAKISDLRSFSGGHGTEPSHDIRGAVASLNRLPHEIGAQLFVLDPVDGQWNSTEELVRTQIPKGLLRPGENIVYVQGNDIALQSGVPSATFVRPAGSFASGFE